ncbi:MAG: hypothetical protein ACLQVY_03595 [Limisphaerales bacterium]
MEDALIVELKVVTELHPIHEAHTVPRAVEFLTGGGGQAR